MQEKLCMFTGKISMSARHNPLAKCNVNKKYGQEDVKRWRAMIRNRMTYEDIRRLEGVGKTTIKTLLEQY